MQTQLKDLLVQKLYQSKAQMQAAFEDSYPLPVARHFALDNLLPAIHAENIYRAFPKAKDMRPLKSAGECRMKCSSMKGLPALLQDLNAALQDQEVVQIIEDITGIKDQVPDPSSLAGGISSLYKGHYINPHLDNSHDTEGKLYRTMNVLYYVSPNWQLENGGHYELWDAEVKQKLVVPSFFNRLVVMETTPRSWHAVSQVKSQAPRCCLFNYYYSEHSPEKQPYSHVTAFMPPPSQPLWRAIAKCKKGFSRSLNLSSQ